MSELATELDPRAELARHVWQADMASEDEVIASTRRIASAMRARRLGRAKRRVFVLAALAIVMLAAFAYAALGDGRARDDSPALELDRSSANEGKRAVEKPSPNHVFIPSTTKKPARESANVESVPQAASKASPARAPAPSRTDKDTPSSADALGTDAHWRQVGEALAVDDAEEARDALSALAATDDPATRAKAKLGLAKLELSRGNRVRARSLAKEVAAMTDIGASLRARASRFADNAK